MKMNMLYSSLLPLLCLLRIAQSQVLMKTQTCSTTGQRAVVQEGATAVIGGVFSMHLQGENSCGEINSGQNPSNMQAFEAIRWAIDRLNKKDEDLNGEYLTDSYIPGVNLGMVVHDYCGSNSAAVTAAEKLFPQFQSGERDCVSNPDQLMLGLIGATTSDATEAVEDFTKKFRIPLLSYSATAPKLSSSTEFPYFMRSVPPDGPLMEVIVKVMSELGWDYVTIVYTDNAYGRGAYYEIRPRFDDANICLTQALAINPTDTSTDAMNKTLNQVLATDTTGVIFLGNVAVANSLLQTAESHPSAGRLQWIFTDSLSLLSSFYNQKYPRGILTIVPGARKITEFEDHWVRIDENNPSPENPWFKDFYMSANRCRLPSITYEPFNSYEPCQPVSETEKRNSFIQDIYVEPAVHAVFTYARALRNAHELLCGGIPGLCNQLRSLSMFDFYKFYLKDISFTYGKAERVESLASYGLEPYNAPATVQYDENGDIIGPVYDIYNFNNYPDSTNFKFIKIGTYLNGQLEIITNRLRMYDNTRDNIIALPKSPCPANGCRPCLGDTADSQYMYLPGDIVINAVFSLHDKGMIPLSCGMFRGHYSSGMQYMEAMVYALNRINKDWRTTRNILPGVQLGALAFDDCSSSILGTHLVTEVQRNARMPPISSNGVPLDARTVDSYIAAHTSELTIPLAELMNEFMKPLVGYAATSTELSDENRFPYFLRTLYGNAMSMRAVVKVLKRLNWNFIQVVHASNGYARNSFKELKRIGAEEGVCIVAAYEMGESRSSEEIVQLLLNRPSVKPVVVIGDAVQYRDFLMGVSQANAIGKLQIIAQENWGTSTAIVEGLEDVAKGVIVLKRWSPDTTAFKNYLEGLRVQTYTANPWFNEWFENLFNCSMDSTGFGMYSKWCENVDVTPITYSEHWEWNEVFPTIYAVYAIAYGLHQTLTDFCGVGYNGICGEYLNAARKGDVLLENIKQAVFQDEAGNPFQFLDGEANIPFEYHNFNGNNYVQVGDYNPLTESFSFEDLQVVRPTGFMDPASECPGICTECLYMFSFQKFMHIPGDITLAGIFNIHNSGGTPFSCGSLRLQNGVQYTEAFAFALDLINSGSTSIILNNITLGGLAFDGCNDPIRASTIASATYAGQFPIRHGMPVIQADEILAWLSYDSQSTINVAELLRHQGVPLVSPGATTSLLNDKETYSTFFRTIPSGAVRSRAMAKLASKLGFKYIITLNAPDAGNRDAVDQFRNYAEIEGICIGASYEFDTDGTVDQLLKYVTESSTRVVAVFADADQYVTDLIERTPATAQLVYMANRHWELSSSSGLSVIMFYLDSPTIEEFREYLKQQMPGSMLRNPWFNEYYEAYHRCNLAGSWQYLSTCLTPSAFPIGDNQYKQDIWTLPTLNAVFALAEGIHRTLVQKCGEDYVDVCSNFVSDYDTLDRIMQNMDEESFIDMSDAFFEFIEREANRGLLIKRSSYGSEFPEGTYINDTLNLIEPADLITKFKNTPSTCTGPCTQCLHQSTDQEKYTYISGDILLAGLFDIHKAGSTPYACGEINVKDGFQLLEAFNYAIQYVNKHKSKSRFGKILRGIDLGGIAFDVCQSPTRAGNLVANIHAENIDLYTNEKKPLNPNRIDIYIGTLESESSIRVADILNVLAIPQISYGATTLELRDSEKYKYFLRTVPADDKQARAIISYLKRFKLSNVQVINSYTSVGQHGVKEFLRLAPLNHICVSQVITVGQDGAISKDEAKEAVAKLLDNPDAKVVIVFASNPKPVLLAAEIDGRIAGTFYFIGTDKWGYGHEALDGLDFLIRGRSVVTFELETADIPDFDKYLEEKTPEDYNRNPWFQEYFQHVYNCSLTGLNSRYTVPCSEDLMGISRAPNYVQDPYVLYVINAVFSTAMGIHEALNTVCGEGYYGTCNIFRTTGEKRQEILKGIKKVNFTDDTQQPFYFTDGGESDRGYHIFEPIQSPYGKGYIFEDVGSYNDTHYLKIDAAYNPKWTSNCEIAGSCHCVFPEYTPSRYMLDESPFDLNIVYVSDIHKLDPSNPYGCGEIDTGGNFQNLMAFFYAISSVNENVDLKLPSSLKLGGMALDTCTRSNRIGQDIYSILSGEGICSAQESGQVIAPSSIVSFLAKDSDNAIATSGVLSPLEYTTLSQSATSVELSDKIFHEYFLRTVPPDNIQANVMSEVLQRFGWNYVMAVYTDNSYGQAAIKTLITRASSAKSVTCFSRILSMPINATIHDANDIIDKLRQQIGSRVVVLFVTTQHARLLLQATTEKNIQRRFIWLGSDTWANSKYVVEDYEDAASGSLTIQIHSMELQNLNNFIKSLTLQDHKGIPDDWFDEYYQGLHECRILTSTVKSKYSQICTGDERITDDMIAQDSFVLHTIISVYMVAQGLNNIEACQNRDLTIAACLSLLDNRKKSIYNGIKGAQWNVLPAELGEDSFTFKFTDSGYGDIGYNILNYHRNFSSNNFDYYKIGYYQDQLTLDIGKYQGFSFLETRNMPTSNCPVGSECKCLNPDLTIFNFNRVEAGASFVITEAGQYIDLNSGLLIEVSKIPDMNDRFNDIWALIVVTIAGVGAFISLCMFIYLLIVYPVHSGTSILGYMLSFGIILLYGLVFAFVVHASEQMCGFRRFCLGFCYAICYCALFVKLVDCWRAPRVDTYVKYSKLGRPFGLFLVALLLVVIQVIINAEWLILEIPNVERVLYSNMLWPRCTPDDFYDEGLVLSLVYIMVLIFLSIILGLLTLNSPRNHYESNWILGIVILSVPTWVIWCVVAILGEYKMRDAAVIVGLLANATVMLFCGPIRKLYLLSKYEAKMAEEDRKSLVYESQKATDYNIMYGNQYEASPRLYDNPQIRDGESLHDSQEQDNVFVYETSHKEEIVAY